MLADVQATVGSASLVYVAAACVLRKLGHPPRPLSGGRQTDRNAAGRVSHGMSGETQKRKKDCASVGLPKP